MEPLRGPFPLSLEPTFHLDPERSLWKPHIETDDRMRAFMHRLLRDFDHHWRHILRAHYKLVHIRKLARGIIRLSTLDFDVRENTGEYTGFSQMLAWEPFADNFVRLAGLWVVLCQDIPDGLLLARKHSAAGGDSTSWSPNMTSSVEVQGFYMILSLKHIMLCTVSDDGTSLKHTAPESLFNGEKDTSPPSELALDYLIFATASARLSVFTPMLSLPIEPQDMILKYSYTHHWAQ